ncbi:hypothetical protein MAPG_05489 [Magnaporthiopsis poae ATCC 64411]|uniref:Uncharacterized protein n=1 Tax=Magnaporthiopsis poae (strain ATCC 64411 / 73-15) TaxID=644358 RepID=A0A0C4DZI7_MAGP6|nr:hypothetical protein MAPG_05489 [Magnaporthiopsis poae ATCC 64411]
MYQYSRKEEDISPVSPLTPTLSLAEGAFDRNQQIRPLPSPLESGALPNVNQTDRVEVPRVAPAVRTWELERDGLDVTREQNLGHQGIPDIYFYPDHSPAQQQQPQFYRNSIPQAAPPTIHTDNLPYQYPSSQPNGGAAWLDDKSPYDGTLPSHAGSWEALAGASPTQPPVPPGASQQQQQQQSVEPPVGSWAYMRRDGWFIEMAALVFSVLCLGGIVGVLVAISNRPVREWAAVTGITPNAVISLLSTLCKTALLMPVASCIGQLKWRHFDSEPRRLVDLDVFDGASRGPAGALTMFLHSSTRSTVAAVGALLTIVALVADPFSQQLITVETRQVVSQTGVAFFSSSLVYDSGATLRQQRTFRAGSRTVDSNMYGAVLEGVFSAATPETSFECSTSNCTWPGTYDFLGVVSSCANVTLETPAVCNGADGGGDASCTYTTPGGIVIDARRYQADGMSHSTVLKAVAASPNSTAEPASIVKYAVWKSTPDGWLTGTFDVTECSLEFAAIYYANVSVTNNKLAVGASAAFPLRGPEEPENDGTGRSQPMFRLTPDLSVVLTERRGSRSNSSSSEGVNGWPAGGGRWRRGLKPATMGVGLSDLTEARRLLQEHVFTANLEEPMPMDASKEQGIARMVLSSVDAAELSRRVAHTMTERIRLGGPGNGGLDVAKVEAAKSSSTALEKMSRDVWVRRVGKNDFIGVQQQQTGG